TSIFPRPHPPAGFSFTLGGLTPEFTQRLNNKIRELLQQMERGLKSADPQDCTAYTGWAGREQKCKCEYNEGWKPSSH
uniref:Uncharacterized protein n=1 Tax=Athene cunicularia TaxID=194338 RepID=A0A663LY39_ATHCN